MLQNVPTICLPTKYEKNMQKSMAYIGGWLAIFSEIKKITEIGISCSRRSAPPWAWKNQYENLLNQMQGNNFFLYTATCFTVSWNSCKAWKMALERGRKTRSNIPTSYYAEQSKAVRHLASQAPTKIWGTGSLPQQGTWNLWLVSPLSSDTTAAEQIYCRRSGRGTAGEIAVCAQ